jgi:hypothetical protein
VKVVCPVTLVMWLSPVCSESITPCGTVCHRGLHRFGSKTEMNKVSYWTRDIFPSLVLKY